MFPNRVEPKLFTSVSFLYLFWLSLNILLGQVWTDDLVRPQPQYNQDANHLNSTSNVIESLPIRDAQDKHHFIDSNHSDRVYLVKGSIPSNLIKNESIDLDRFKSGKQSETSTIQTSFHHVSVQWCGGYKIVSSEEVNVVVRNLRMILHLVSIEAIVRSIERVRSKIPLDESTITEMRRSVQ
ncbi:hypothetical protein QR98_0044580 [Sarcoptes scabiei]|uniref:Uncharacterized protein n=1 Tax=Sarcoptes scabiei TaxID=52283 RepID=A0A132A5T2_SARSC|nr:hypothetical protein QR98_0044580 [Sarcoptes scabiei]